MAQTRLYKTSDADRAEAKAILKQLIEINTTDTPQGNVTTATAAMQKVFLDAGFPAEDVHLLGPNERKQNPVSYTHLACLPGRMMPKSMVFCLGLSNSTAPL